MYSKDLNTQVYRVTACKALGMVLSTSKGSGRELLDVIAWIPPDKVSSLGSWNPAWVRVSGCCLSGRRVWNFLKEARYWQQLRLPEAE